MRRGVGRVGLFGAGAVAYHAHDAVGFAAIIGTRKKYNDKIIS